MGHEHTVGQDGAHDEHAEERDAGVKEAVGGAYPQIPQKAMGGATRNREKTLPIEPRKGLQEAIEVPSTNPQRPKKTARDGVTQTHGRRSAKPP